MKKLVIFILVTIMILSFVGCSSSPEELYSKAREAYDTENYVDAYKYAKKALKHDEENAVMRKILDLSSFNRMRDYYMKHGDQKIGSLIGEKHIRYKDAEVSLIFSKCSLGCNVKLKDYYCEGLDANLNISVGYGFDPRNNTYSEQSTISIELRHRGDFLAEISDSDYTPSEIGINGFNRTFDIKGTLNKLQVKDSSNLERYLAVVLCYIDGKVSTIEEGEELAGEAIEKLAGWYDEFFVIFDEIEKKTSISLYDIGFTQWK